MRAPPACRPGCCCWTTQPVFRSRRAGSDRAYDEVAPEELIDAEMSLDFWVDAQGRVGPHRRLSVRPEDAHGFVETDERHRTAEEYEGYMGNYGDTLDYWYRRAALEQPVRQGRVLLAAYAELAAALPEDDAATGLLRPFDPTAFMAEDAAVLAELARRRGTGWLVGLLQAWYGPEHRPWHVPGVWRPRSGLTPEPPRLWPRDLPAFVAAAQASGWPSEGLATLFDAGLRLLARFHEAAAAATPARQQSWRCGLIEAAVQVAQALVRQAEAGTAPLRGLIDMLLSQPQLYPLTELTSFVQATGPLARHWPQPESLQHRIGNALRQALTEPERSATTTACGVSAGPVVARTAPA